MRIAFLGIPTMLWEASIRFGDYTKFIIYQINCFAYYVIKFQEYKYLNTQQTKLKY